MHISSKRSRESDESSEDLETAGWDVLPTHRKRKILLISFLIGILVVASIVVVLVEVSQQSPVTAWHAFNGVFDNNAVLVTEDCNVQGLNTPLGGVGVGKVYSGTVVTCSYRGTSYTGYFGNDCNMQKNGPIPSVESILVPYEGCVLGQAPLTYDFEGIFTLGAKSNTTIQVYSQQKVIANMTPSSAWKSFQCSLASDNLTRSNGPMSCKYLAVPYQANVIGACNLGSPIAVEGTPVPADSCVLARAESVSG